MNLVTRSAAVALVATALSGLALALPGLHHSPLGGRPAVVAVADGTSPADATASPNNEDWG